MWVSHHGRIPKYTPCTYKNHPTHIPGKHILLMHRLCVIQREYKKVFVSALK
uniref:Uncharacterized protein n=1 Tax=Anguilla anguilla TaxID=7936 RepID=A0A0E9W817_ANGAN